MNNEKYRNYADKVLDATDKAKLALEKLNELFNDPEMKEFGKLHDNALNSIDKFKAAVIKMTNQHL